MRALHLFIADLFPPEEFTAPAPAGLAALLVRGEPLPGPDPEADALGRLFGLGQRDGPAAHLLAGEGTDPGADYWMRLDPVHLRFQRDRLYLADATAFELEAAEALALLDSLNAHFAADGLSCLAPHPKRWYVRLPAAPDLVTQPLDAVAGRRIDPRLPRGGDAPRWLGLINEVQMLFHDHPVNQAREAAGRPPVNSVWPWGGGYRRPLPPAAWADVRTDMPVARALARAAGAPVGVPPARLDVLIQGGGTGLVATGRLSAAARYGDPDAWLRGLLDLEENWFRPALAALRRGRLDRLVLEGTGATPRAVALTPRRAWRFWRR